VKKALVVRGGWDGHQPIETTNVFIPYLQSHGYEVRIEESPKVYTETEYMRTVDLIQQTNTMSTIEREEFSGLQQAIINGTGYAGWHGGIADSYRNSSDYLHMMGGQFANHPGKDPSECIGEQSDNYVPYTVNMTALGENHEITKGIGDFEITSEQYWVLHDDYLDVLATTTQKVRPWDPWNREVTSPAIWTRKWGKGKIFVITCGHNLEVVLNHNVRTIIERGLLWASR
jgi:type 1 glutamine amidotransferase